MNRLPLLVAGLAGLLAFGFVTTPSPRVKHTIPARGTVFVNTYYATDSTGAIPPRDSTDPRMPDDTVVVATRPMTFHGKGNCVAITAYAHEDTTFISYASNGDLWILNSGKANKWERLVFGQPIHKIFRTPVHLDTGHVLGSYYAMDRHSELEVLGWDTMSVAGLSALPVVRMRSVDVMAYNKKSMGGHAPDEEYKNATNYWYAPSLGYFARINFGWDTKYFLNQELRAVLPPRQNP